MYKKYVIIVLSIFFFTINLVKSQNTRNWKFGVKGGLNQSVINAKDSNGEKSGYIGTEIYGGFVAEYQIKEKHFFQTSGLISYTDHITFIELPIYYKYNIWNEISVFGGGKISYIPDNYDFWFYYYRKRLGYFADIGADYKIFKNFYVEALFSKAFTKQIDDNALEYYDGKRNVYRLGLVYFF